MDAYDEDKIYQGHIYEFIELCRFLQGTDYSRLELSHEFRIFLFLYKYIHDVSHEHLGVLLGVTRKSIERSYDDVLFYFKQFFPHIPRFWNDVAASSYDVTKGLHISATCIHRVQSYIP